MDDYRSLRDNMLNVYSTQPCGVIYKFGDLYSEAEKRRDRLYRKWERRRDIPYGVLRVGIMVVYLAVVGVLTYLLALVVQDTILFICLGYIWAQLFQLVWMFVEEGVMFEGRNVRFERRIKNKV
jgi:hypothetical protein